MNESRNPSIPPDRTQHVDEMTCMLYVERQLDRAKAQEVSAHTRECVSCQSLLHALERESKLLTRAMLEEAEPLPARLAQFQEKVRRSLQWIWTVGFALAATGAYALYTGYVAPWQQQLDQAGFGGSNLLSLLIFQGAFWKGWQSMVTLLEVVALISLAGFALLVFRRHLRRGSALAIVLAALFAMMTFPAIGSATEYRKGNSIDVKQDETIKGDIYLFGQRVRIDGTVDGDAIVFAHDVVVNGHVTGDVISFGQTIEVNGQVDGNVRSAGNSLTVNGVVNKNVMDMGNSAYLDAKGKVGGSWTVLVGQELTVDGHLGRDVLALADHAVISGIVGGGLRIKGETLAINSGAQIDGPIRFDGTHSPDVSSQAKLASPVDFHKTEEKPRFRQGHYYVWQVIWMAAFILFGLVLFQLMPVFSAQAVANTEHYGASFGLGLLVCFAVPIAAIIACFTVVGLFLGITALFLWYATLYYAQLVVGAIIGQWLMGRTSEIWPLIGRMVVGVIVVRLATTIPEVGGWIKFGVILWGMGATSLALYRRLQPQGPSSEAYTHAPMTPLPPNTTMGGAPA